MLENLKFFWRANTWDQDKITKIQQWLKDNFQPTEEDKKP